MIDKSYKSGFTLIELSIVLVIIGLIVGGVLVGQDLIAAARVRSQISQIQQYQTAVNTFKIKYAYLPGDMPPTEKTNYGFTVHATGNNPIYGASGNNVIDGSGYSFNAAGFTVEPNTFWINLYEAGLFEFKPLLADLNTDSTTNVQSYYLLQKLAMASMFMYMVRQTVLVIMLGI